MEGLLQPGRGQGARPDVDLMCGRGAACSRRQAACAAQDGEYGRFLKRRDGGKRTGARNAPEGQKDGKCE